MLGEEPLRRDGVLRSVLDEGLRLGDDLVDLGEDLVRRDLGVDRELLARVRRLGVASLAVPLLCLTLLRRTMSSALS